MTAKATLLEYFKTYHPKNVEGVKEMVQAFEWRAIEKNTLLLREGQQENLLSFMVAGSVREFYVGEEKESNINFFTQPQFITDLSSLMYNQATRKNQQALVDTELLVLGKEQFDRLLDKYDCGRDWMQSVFVQLLQARETWDYEYRTKSADQLYQHLLQKKPQWLQQIPQYHIASLLRITPETLSRIRKRLA